MSLKSFTFFRKEGDVTGKRKGDAAGEFNRKEVSVE